MCMISWQSKVCVERYFEVVKYARNIAHEPMMFLISKIFHVSQYFLSERYC